MSRGMNQLGTLGSSNHYLKIQGVRPEGIHDPVTARALGVCTPGQVCVMLHCGSRGFGHQIATDYGRRFDQVMPSYGIAVRDREAGFAYKDLSAVVDVLRRLDISRKVVSLTPIGNIKG